MWHVCVYTFARGRAYVCASVCVHTQCTYLYLSSVSACLLLVWQIINLLTFFWNVFKLMGHKYLVEFPRGGMIQVSDLTWADFACRSSNYTDENTWGAAWLYKATGEQQYLQDAQTHYAHEPAWGFSWDEKTAGNHVSCAFWPYGAQLPFFTVIKWMGLP